MTDAEKINRLRSWLTYADHGGMTALSVRAVLRVLPVGMKRPEVLKEPGIEIHLLQALIISCVSSRYESIEVRSAARIAAKIDAAGITLRAVNSLEPLMTLDAALATCALAGMQVLEMRQVEKIIGMALTAIDGYDTNLARTAGYWEQLFADCEVISRGRDRFARPLWAGVEPAWFRTADAEMRAIWAADPPAHWAFWTRWWDGVLAGKPLNWDMQHDIALIPDAVWKAGPGPVAEAIERIELRFELDRLIRENPFAWRILFDTNSRKFEAIAVEQRDLLNIVESVRRSIDEFHQRCRSLRISDFGQALELAFAPVVKLLRTDLKRYKDSPLSLLKAIEAARAEMEDIAGKEHFLTESFLTRFLLRERLKNLPFLA